jgi:hypothetical protein
LDCANAVGPSDPQISADTNRNSQRIETRRGCSSVVTVEINSVETAHLVVSKSDIFCGGRGSPIYLFVRAIQFGRIRIASDIAEAGSR